MGYKAILAKAKVTSHLLSRSLSLGVNEPLVYNTRNVSYSVSYLVGALKCIMTGKDNQLTTIEILTPSLKKEHHLRTIEIHAELLKRTVTLFQ